MADLHTVTTLKTSEHLAGDKVELALSVLIFGPLAASKLTQCPRFEKSAGNDDDRPLINIRCLPFKSAQRLVNHDTRMRQRRALAFGAASKKNCSHARSLPDTNRNDIGTHILHGIVDRHTSRHRSSRTIDVEINIFLRIFTFKKKKLRDDKISHNVIYFSAKKNDALLKKARVNVIRALTSSGLLDYIRNIRHRTIPFENAPLNNSPKIRTSFARYAPRGANKIALPPYPSLLILVTQNQIQPRPLDIVFFSRTIAAPFRRHPVTNRSERTPAQTRCLG